MREITIDVPEWLEKRINELSLDYGCSVDILCQFFLTKEVVHT